MSTKRLNDVLDYINDQGLRVLQIQQGNHYKIVVSLPNGERRKLHLARTSVSNSGLENFKALVRRMARGDYR